MLKALLSSALAKKMALPSENVAHRPGAFKQQNKTHKHGRHRSNRSLESLSRGKVNLKAITRKNRHQMKKQERKNQLQQLRKLKREEATERKRSLGGAGVPPFLTAIIPLHKNEDAVKFLELVKSCDDDAVITESSQGYCHISLPRFKKRYSFVLPRPGDVYATLDAAKVADSTVLLYSLEDGGYDDTGDMMLSILFSQGLPSPIHVVQGLDALPQKQRADVKKQVSKTLESRFPGEKLRVVDKKEDGLLLLRQIADQKRRPINYRDSRPHLLAESIEFCPNEDQNLVGTLKVSGYIRGKPLSVNSLVHIPGHGDFQMSQIDAPDDPHLLVLKPRDNSKSVEMAELTPKVLEKADPLKQESLQSENVPDAMDGEQTWPTPEELAEAEAMQTQEESKKKVVKKVPKGTSDYQACWIVDEGSAAEEGSESESDGEHDGEEGFEPMDDEADEEETDNATIADDTESISIAGGKEGYDNHLDLEEEKASLVRFREERMDQMFPDEVDTPLDRTARTRFARYRGLKSFHSSPWDPKENLPLDYARVFQFENFARTKKRVLSEEKDGAMPGWYVTVHVANVPRTVYDAFQGQGDPLVLFGLLPHEQKMSVLNVAVKRHPGGYAAPIKSKERLVFHIGYRRFSACPIFSAHTNGDKHKYDRFLRTDAVSVATMFAPIIFPPASAVVFIEDDSGQHQLVGSGAVLGANPDRVVVKRAVLSGHPFKINRKSAVVRYMFFNRDDIMWFKPVELKTKYGRRGHIKEALGTHGHMKCVFNGQLKSQDTVLMHLYKRMFPKWTYDPEVEKPAPYYKGHSKEDGEECKAFSLME
ncbi:tsr1 ribosome assembly factor isoform X2 [Haemaphysalis longicornis]